MEFSLAETFARGFDQFSSIIGNGTFDRIMVRPRSSVLQVLGQRIEFTRLGRMVQAVIILLTVFLWVRLTGAFPESWSLFLCSLEEPLYLREFS